MSSYYLPLNDAVIGQSKAAKSTIMATFPVSKVAVYILVYISFLNSMTGLQAVPTYVKCSTTI